MPKNNNNSNKQIPKEVEIPNLNLISLFRKNVEKNQNKPALYFLYITLTIPLKTKKVIHIHQLIKSIF